MKQINDSMEVNYMKQFWFLIMTDKETKDKAIKHCEEKNLDYDINSRWMDVDGMASVRFMGLVCEKEEYDELKNGINKGAEAVIQILKIGIDNSMNIINAN